MGIYLSRAFDLLMKGEEAKLLVLPLFRLLSTLELID
jgi:hypothetical protein